MKILLGLLLTAAPMVTDEQNAESRTRQLIRLAPLLSAVDLNRDGSVSAEELEKAVESIRSIDRNGDGTIQPEERSLRAAVAFQSATRAEDEGRAKDRGDDDDRGRDGRDPRPESRGPRGARPDGDRPGADRGPDAERGRRPDSDRGPENKTNNEDRRDRDSKDRESGGPENRNRFVPGPEFGHRRSGDGGFGFGGSGFGGRGSFGGGGGFGPGRMPFGRPDRIAHQDGKHESGKPDGDQPQAGKPPLLHRPEAGNKGPDHKAGRGPAPIHKMAGRPGQPMRLHAVGGSSGIIAILFRLLDVDHNGSLSLPEFQRIADGLHSGPSTPTGPPMLHSQGPRGHQPHRIAQSPQAPKIHAMPRRSGGPSRANHRGPGGHDSQSGPDHDRGPDSHRGPDGPERRDHKPDRDRPDGARPTDATLQTIESDWI